MSASTKQNYGGESGEQRAARRRAALLDAAITVVAEQGWRQLNVERVCTSAGLIKRYFYESFADIDALAAAVIDELATEILTLVVVNDLSIPRPQLMRTMIEKLVDYAVNDPRRARVFFGEMAATEAASHQRGLAIRRIVTILAAEARTLSHADHPMLDITASVLVNGSTRTLIDWLDGTIAVPREEFINYLTWLWLSASEGAIAHVASTPAEN
ncbi:TetR/AcrR family transcriptional regulator [Nocardia sp. SYP-A9097]|uniref:TetR/AcrR family transcriptional regulator n=1 Tax=Nocardia sp. SYP-A9097 TaxID=2663237 RepID=UPI00129BD501|nr:TetR/AcrR family transcriptional regulator [Nocardia sp. SYP-A9097]